MTNEVYEIFCHVETVFHKSTSHVTRHIDSKKKISELIENPSVLYNFIKIRNQCSEKVSKEVALNLLDDLMTLYIHVRTFPLVKISMNYTKLL